MNLLSSGTALARTSRTSHVTSHSLSIFMTWPHVVKINKGDSHATEERRSDRFLGDDGIP